MFSNELKNTKCGRSCEFSKITKFCYDCPALLCAKCDRDIHSKEDHNTIVFQNNDNNWNDKSLIMSLFDDDTLGLKVFKEVSRKISTNAKNTSKERRHTPVPEFQKDTFGGWACKSCTFINKTTNMKCSSCYLYRVIEDHSGEYDSKLSNYMKKINKRFIELEKIEDIPLEHVISEFLSSPEMNSDIVTWFNQKYLNNKSLIIINEVINEHGHGLSMNDLQDKYYKLIKTKNDNILKILPKTIKNKIDLVPDNLLKISDVNKKIKLPYINEVKEEEIWQIIKKVAKFSNPERRMLIAELNLPSNEKVNLLQVMLSHAELGPYLKENCPGGSVKITHVRQTLVDQILITDMLNFLKKECGMCCGDYPMPMMQPMLTCSHEFCKNCFKSWLEADIKDKYPCKWMCPSCSEDSNNADRNLYYYNIREFLRENNCNAATIKIFDEKLLQEKLQGSPNFHWCANSTCENGFEAYGENNKIQCPSCSMHMCVQCNREWKKEHENVSCQEYEMFMLKNDPNLAKILNEIGIECPKCAMRYALAPGGCLHFECRTCGWVFCGSCYIEFTRECKLAGCNLGKAFHAHHPRNCFYYMRDYSAPELENMLKNADYPKLLNKLEKICPYMIAEEHTLVNRKCGVAVYKTTGLCEPHYKEYLAQFINRLKIDPADFVDADALNLMLYQGLKNKLVPNKGENNDAFLIRLRNEIKNTCGLYIPKGLEVAQPKA